MKLKAEHLKAIKKRHTLEDVVYQYLDSLDIRDSTQKLYESQLRHAIHYFGDTLINEIDLAGIEQFQMNLIRKQGLKRSTVKSIVKSFKRLLSYLARHRLIESNPADELVMVKEKAKIGYIPSESEVCKLVEVMYENAVTVETLKYSVAINTILVTANRLQETLNLTFDDIDRDNLTIRLRAETTKDGKEHRKVITKELVDKIDMLEEYRTCEYIFSTRNQEPIKSQHVQRFLKKILAIAGIKNNITLHSLRRYTITSFVNNGGSITVASRMLANHSSVTTTERYYLKPSEDKMIISIKEYLSNKF